MVTGSSPVVSNQMPFFYKNFKLNKKIILDLNTKPVKTY